MPHGQCMNQGGPTFSACITLTIKTVGQNWPSWPHLLRGIVTEYDLDALAHLAILAEIDTVKGELIKLRADWWRARFSTSTTDKYLPGSREWIKARIDGKEERLMELGYRYGRYRA